MEQFTIREKTYNIILDRSEYFANAKNFNKDNEIKMNDDEFKEFTEQSKFLEGEIGFHTNNKSFLMLNDKYYVNKKEDFNFKVITYIIAWTNHYMDKGSITGLLTVKGVFDYIHKNNVHGDFAVAIVAASATKNKKPIIDFILDTFNEGKFYNYLVANNVSKINLYTDKDLQFNLKLISEFKNDIITKISYRLNENIIVISWEYNQTIINFVKKTGVYLELMQSFATSLYDTVFKMTFH